MHLRKALLFVGLAAVLSAATAARGQEIVTKHAGIGGRGKYFLIGIGATDPTSANSPVSEHEGGYRLGLALRAGLAFRMNERVLFGPEFEYHHYPENGNNPPLDRNVSIVAATVRYSLGMPMPKSRAESAPEQNTAYVLIGSLGMAAIDEWGKNSGTGMFGVGLGVMRRYSDHFTVTMDARWEYTFEHGEHFLPIAIGVAF